MSNYSLKYQNINPQSSWKTVDPSLLPEVLLLYITEMISHDVHSYESERHLPPSTSLRYISVKQKPAIKLRWTSGSSLDSSDKTLDPLRWTVPVWELSTGLTHSLLSKSFINIHLIWPQLLMLIDLIPNWRKGLNLKSKKPIQYFSTVFYCPNVKSCASSESIMCTSCSCMQPKIRFSAGDAVMLSRLRVCVGVT